MGQEKKEAVGARDTISSVLTKCKRAKIKCCCFLAISISFHFRLSFLHYNERWARQPQNINAHKYGATVLLLHNLCLVE